MSRVTRAMRGGSQKVTNDGGGVTIPPKNDDIIYIYKQPQKDKILFEPKTGRTGGTDFKVKLIYDEDY